MNRIENEAIDNLFKAILSLENIDECYRFFEDACTIQELESISQRFEVARQLSDGKSYAQVNKATGASTATICRVGKCVNYGSGGYKMAIDRLKRKDG
ncbi:MAG: YerC/YecD family TrpR-related protein [Oscillospiraceae bacterium]|nr:YerC/YecD family TrpR-related protein [Oscillospiraceae bacterium]